MTVPRKVGMFGLYHFFCKETRLKPSFFVPKVRSVSGRPLPRHSWLGAGAAGRWMDCRARCSTSVGLPERRLHSTAFQAQRHPPKQTAAHLTRLRDWSHLALCWSCPFYQRGRRRAAAATRVGQRHRRKCWEAEERGKGTKPCTLTFMNEHLGLSYVLLPLFFQDELLNELLAEMKALRAVVLAQSQRIELLERQLARIEDGDVWAKRRRRKAATFARAF